MSIHRYNDNAYQVRAKSGVKVWGRIGKGFFSGKIVSGLKGEKVEVLIENTSQNLKHLKGKKEWMFFETLGPGYMSDEQLAYWSKGM